MCRAAAPAGRSDSSEVLTCPYRLLVLPGFPTLSPRPYGTKPLQLGTQKTPDSSFVQLPEIALDAVDQEHGYLLAEAGGEVRVPFDGLFAPADAEVGADPFEDRAGTLTQVAARPGEQEEIRMRIW